MDQKFGHQSSRHWTQARNAPDPDPQVANDPREPFVPHEQFDGAALAGWTPATPDMATATAAAANVRLALVALADFCADAIGDLTIIFDRIIPVPSVLLVPTGSITERHVAVMKSDRI